MRRHRLAVAASALALLVAVPAASAGAAGAQTLPEPPRPPVTGAPGTNLQSLGPAQDLLRTLPVFGPILGGPATPTTPPTTAPGGPTPPPSLLPAPAVDALGQLPAAPAAPDALAAAPAALPNVGPVDTEAVVQDTMARLGRATAAGAAGLGG
ncbi:MAG TPA: hypothetical protein VIL36_15865 [Acidimicrobiales bacterium]